MKFSNKTQPQSNLFVIEVAKEKNNREFLLQTGDLSLTLILKRRSHSYEGGTSGITYCDLHLSKGNVLFYQKDCVQSDTSTFKDVIDQVGKDKTVSAYIVCSALEIIEKQDYIKSLTEKAKDMSDNTLHNFICQMHNQENNR